MSSLRIAGAQIPVGDLKRNEQAIIRSISRAADAKADILLTPEGSLSGYTWNFKQAEVDEALERVTAAARVAGVGLVVGTCHIDQGCRWDQMRFYERDGSYLGFHAKILLSRSYEPLRQEDEYDWFMPGKLRTFEFGGVTIAGLIGNDLWASPGITPGSDPGLVREAVKLGARVIFHAANSDRMTRHRELVRSFHEAKVRMLAWQLHVPIATVDNAAPPALRCSAPSGVVGIDGHWLVRAPCHGEHLYVTDVETS